MQYSIELAGVNILADVPFLLHSSEPTTEFVHPAVTESTSLRMEFHPVKKLPEPSDVRCKKSSRAYVGEGKSAGTFFFRYPGESAYAFVARDQEENGFLLCEYLPEYESFMNYAKDLIYLMDIEATLLHFGGLILHASLIRKTDDAGIVFSAPSGTGKSTQADLWAEHEGADVLNGDRAALRKIDGEWRAFGLPYAGTSGIYRNESAPLKALVALRQAPENRIRKLSVSEAFRYLYPETLIHRWDPDFESRATALLLEVMSEVPVYLLECRPDKDAVELLKTTLENSQKGTEEGIY